MAYRLFTNKKYVTKDNLKPIVEMAINNVLSLNGQHFSKFEIKKVGRLLYGDAYSHDFNQHYGCIGLEVELETQYVFQDKPNTAVGVYAVWKETCHKFAPIIFDEAYSALGKAYRFTNGCGDHVEVMKELASIEEVIKVISDNNISLSGPRN